VAQIIVRQLPQDQTDILAAYAAGVNYVIDHLSSPPFEFRVLRYRPARWRMEDSILVVLGMFEVLSRQGEDEERMLSVMEETLPQNVVAFLTPDTDRYTEALLEGTASRRPMQPIPVDALATLRRPVERHSEQPSGIVRARDSGVGSNAWAAAHPRTTDGRAILANDMHLDITVPNIWYWSQIHYGDVALTGVTLPGVPGMVAGASAHLAWGFTNVQGDFLDLVAVEVNPDDADEYRIHQGWQRFGMRHETIKVRGGDDVQVGVKTTIWGPVARKPLLDQPVAIRWTALDPTAVDLGLLALEQARSLEDGIMMMNRAGGPPLNALVVDETGRIAWTYTGRIPMRQGFDGATSRSWAEGETGWTGYIAPEALPRLVDPPAGFLVSANNRALGQEYPYVIGHDFVNGYRAYRVAERLQAMDGIGERDMLNLQLDTVSRFYADYQQLALAVLTPQAISDKPALEEVRRTLEAWDGRADVDSLGIGLLSRFRQVLAQAVFTPFLASCLQRDPTFTYAWAHIDTPLQQLLAERIPQVLPDPLRYASWEAFILGNLEESVRQVKAQYTVTSLRDLTWGRMNRRRFHHPFSRAFSALGWLLDIGGDELAGCSFCVRVTHGSLGASMRLVISPGRPQEALMHMPGGQSGHPLSPHYHDLHAAWVQGVPLALSATVPQHTLRLLPRRGP
jgi:penicillin amidase